MQNTHAVPYKPDDELSVRQYAAFEGLEIKHTYVLLRKGIIRGRKRGGRWTIRLQDQKPLPKQLQHF